LQKWLGYILGNFFTSSSGHPGCRRRPIQFRFPAIFLEALLRNLLGLVEKEARTSVAHSERKSAAGGGLSRPVIKTKTLFRNLQS
jgi:hypothetical protein